MMALRKIVSGGQTGVDRAALDAAMESGVAVGGWCPRGGRAEDGPIPARYPLKETPEARYSQRTRWNVRDSDGTLILVKRTGPLSGGTALTAEIAEELGKPLYIAHIAEMPEVLPVAQWIDEHAIAVLNVAGPRASQAKSIYAQAADFMEAVLQACS